ncbi:MAG: hypothetical protein V7703_03470 [Hyphomicrobiales bacterium]
MSIMSHLNEQNALTAREKRKLPDGLVTKHELISMIDPHFSQTLTLFEILCHLPSYSERIDAIDEFITPATRHQALAGAMGLGQIATRSRSIMIAILQRWRADIDPANSVAFDDPVSHNPAHTNLAPEDCAA